MQITHARRFIERLARMTKYNDECSMCGQPADVPNKECFDGHEPFVPGDDDDAANTMNSLIAEARQIVAVASAENHDEADTMDWEAALKPRGATQ